MLTEHHNMVPPKHGRGLAVLGRRGECSAQPLPDVEAPPVVVPFDRDELGRAVLADPELCAVLVFPAPVVVLAPVPVAVPVVVNLP